MLPVQTSHYFHGKVKTDYISEFKRSLLVEGRAFHLVSIEFCYKNASVFVTNP